MAGRNNTTQRSNTAAFSADKLSQALLNSRQNQKNTRMYQELQNAENRLKETISQSSRTLATAQKTGSRKAPGDWMDDGKNFITYTGDYTKPFEGDYLNGQYTQAVKALNGANKKKTKSASYILRDAFLLVDQQADFGVESAALQGYDMGKSEVYLQAAQKNFEKMLGRKQAEYEAEGLTAQEQFALLTQSGYKGRGQRLQEDESRYQEWLAAQEPQQPQGQTENAWIQTLRGMNDKDRQRSLDALDSAGTLWNRVRTEGAYALTPEEMGVLQALTEGRTDAELQTLTPWEIQEQADAWRQEIEESQERAGEKDPEYGWLQEMHGISDQSRQDELTALENAGMLWQRMLQGKAQGLTDGEIDALNDLFPDLAPEERERITPEEAQARANEKLAAARGIWQGRDAELTPWQEEMLKIWRQTPEGAEAWVKDAQGTGDEEKAKNNLWFVNEEQKYSGLRAAPDYAQLSQYMAPDGFDSADDLFYGLVNGDPDAMQAEAISQQEGRPNTPGIEYSNLTADEKAPFNYLWNNNRRDEAREYLEYMSYTANQRWAEQARAEAMALAEKGPLGAAVASISSVAMNPLRGAGYLDVLWQKAQNALTGNDRPIDRNRGANRIGQTVDAYREGVMGTTDWMVNILGRDMDLFDFIYGTGMSGLDSLLAGGTGAKAASVILGLNAAQSAMQDIYDRDGTDQQALIGGLASGIFEGFFEKFSIGAFYDEAKRLGTDSIKDWLINIAAQTGINASEEFFTSVANAVYDTVAMRDKSEFAQKRDYYAAHGLTGEGEAEARALWDLCQQAIEEGAGGALMGSWFGAVSSATSAKRTRSADRLTGQGIISQDTRQTLKEIGLTLPTGSEGRNLAEKFNPGKAGARETGKLYRSLYTFIKNSPHMQDAMASRMTQDVMQRLRGSAEADGGEAARAIVALYSGEEITQEQMEAIAHSGEAMDALGELMGVGEEAAEGEGAKEQTARPAAEGQAASPEAQGLDALYGAQTQAEPIQAPSGETSEGSFDHTQSGFDHAQSTEEEGPAQAAEPREPMLRVPAQQENGRQTETAVLGVKEGQEGEATATLADGSTVDVGDLNVDDSQKELLSRAARMGQDAGRDMVQHYEDGQDVASYAIGYQRIYNGAREGKTLAEIHTLFGQTALTEAQQQAAYAAGQREAARMEAEKAKITKRCAEQEGYGTLEDAGKDSTGVLFGNVTKQLTGSARGQLAIIDAFAKKYGLQVRAYDTLGSANANYESGSNIINLGLDADEGALTRVVSHEGFHFIKNWNGEAAQQLQDLVLDSLRATDGYDLDARVQDLQQRYRKNGQELQESDALEEIAADSMLDVIGSRETVQQLMKENPTLAARIRDWLQRVMRDLQSALKRFTKNSPEAKALLPQIENVQKMHQLYTDALAAAQENYIAAQQGATQSARQDTAVTDYMRDMEAGADAAEALNGLVSQLFFQTQGDWIQGHMDADMDAALQQFSQALMNYRKNETALSVELEKAGFAAPEDMSALSYAADQLVGREGRTGEEPEVKYDIRRGTTKTGRDVSFVQASRQVITGDDASQWGQQVTDYINRIIRKGKDVTVYTENGVPLTITKDTAGKAAYWNRDISGNRVSEEEYGLKLRIESHIDEAGQVSIGQGNRAQDTKNHRFAQKGFNYRTAYFQDFDGRYYSFVISVGADSNRVNTIYNVNQIKEAELPNTLKGAQPQNATVGLTASEERISQTGEEVNKKFSMKNDDVASDVEDDAALYAQVESDRDAKEALELLQRLDESARAEAKGAWEKRLPEIVNKIITETGSKISRKRLQEMLTNLYTAMENENISLGEKVMYARQAVKEAMLTGGSLQEGDETTREALRLIRTRGFYLTDDMKSEIRETYGSVETYRRKNFGKMALRSKGLDMTKGPIRSLIELWDSLGEMMPGVFPAEASEADMPIILDAFVESGWNRTYDAFYGGDGEAFATDLAYRTMLEYYNIPDDMTKTYTREIRNEFRERLEEYRQNYQQKQEEKARVSKARAEATARKEKLRGEISRDVKYLNTRTVSPTDSRHVPEALRDAVIAAILPFTEKTGVWSAEKAAQLRREYQLIGKSDQSIRWLYDEETADRIERLEKTLEGRTLSQLTEAELSDLRDIVGNLKKMVDQGNEMLVNGQRSTLEKESEQFISEMQQKQTPKNKWLRKLQGLTYQNMTPTYYADRVGGVVQAKIQELFDGQNQWAFTMKTAKERAEALAEQYHVNDWIHDEHLRFKTQRGETLELSKGEALALYATWKRETSNRRQNANHLRVGGFTYGPKVEYEGVDTTKPHAITAADMQQVMDYLGKEQMAYADEMVRYLSEDMATLGNETSMALYGYNKFGEGYYFPYSSDKHWTYQEFGSQEDTGSKQIKNAGMTKATVKNASNPVILGDFLDVWAGHVNQMALYNAFAVTSTDLNRLLNFSTVGQIMVDSGTGREDLVAAQSLRLAMESALGKDAVQYLQTLLKDVNGGVRADERTAAGKMVSLFKKGSVAANASVTLQQPSAIMRAMYMVNPKYFMKKNPAHIGQNIREMETYSGVAIIKDMGRFDTGTGKGAVEWLNDYVKEENKRKAAYNWVDKWTGMAPEWADRVTWAAIWGTVKREVAATMPGIEADHERYMRTVAERFNDVCNHTQVYDSTLSKSSLMRSQSLFSKIVTSFMAEPTLSFNMLMQGMENIGTPGGKARAGRAVGAFVAACVVNSLLKSLATMGRRKDDEERTVIEKYLGEVVENLGEDLSPQGIISLVPIARDVVSIFQGYDVGRSDMDVVEQLYNALKTVKNENKTALEKIETVAGAVGSAAGVPLKNVIRDVNGMLNLLRSAPASETSMRDIQYTVLDSLPSILGIQLWDSKHKAYYERIEDAMIKGDDRAVEEMSGYLQETEKVKDTTLETGVKNAMKESVAKGILTQNRAAELLTKYFKKDPDKAWFEVEKWQQELEHQDDEDYSYSQYREVTDLVKAGKNITEAMKKLTSHGKSEKDVRGQIKTAIGEWYRAGEISGAEAKKKLKQYVPTLTENDIYWTLEEWEWKKSHGKEEKYSKYNELQAAIEKQNNTSITSALKKLTDHGVKKDDVASQITTMFKKTYIDLYKSGKSVAAANLKASLLSAYEACGKDRDKKNKEIDKWLDEKKTKN